MARLDGGAKGGEAAGGPGARQDGPGAGRRGEVFLAGPIR